MLWQNLFLIISLLTGFASVSVAADDTFPALPDRMAQFVADEQAVGVLTLVGQGGEIVQVTAVGYADEEKKKPITVDTLFGIASMTKPITATAMMILVDEGKLSVDDPVAKYIPAFADAKLANGEPVRDLKIRHLLTHTSGLTGDQLCYDSLEATADELAHRPFEFQPGEKWEYGPSMNVCGRIIEIVSGQPFDEFVTKRILKPLHMNHTTFHLTPKQLDETARVYKIDEETKELVPSEPWISDGSAEAVPNPSGGLFASAPDMFKFYQMILNGGKLDGHRIVSKEAVKAMTTPQTGDIVTGFTPGNAWGLGWGVVREPQGVTGMLSPGSFGHGGAYGTEGWVDPVKERIFVLMYQRSDVGNSDGADIRRDFQQLAVDALELN